MIKTDIKLLDSFFKGNRKEICCVYGPPASGKTTIAKEAAIYQSKRNKKVIFIDSEKSFSIDRMMQLTSNDKEVLNNIFVLKPNNLKEQGKFLKNLLKLKDIKLVILDSMGIYYRLDLKRDIRKANNEIHGQFNVLSELCLMGVSVIITNQVYSNIDTNNISVVGGDMLRNWSKYLVKLEKDPGKLFLEKPETKEVLFKIGNEGLY